MKYVKGVCVLLRVNKVKLSPKTNTIKSKELNDYISITIKFTLGNVGGIHTDC